jgi:ABC-2 type transport system permease protein
VSGPGPVTTFRGPSALGGDLRRVRSLTVVLAATDFKLRFYGSVLGYVWTVARPLMLFGVLYLVFTKVVRFGSGVPHYPVYLLSSLMLFSFFGETTTRGVTSLVERESLLRKMRFPRMAIPLSVALHASFFLGLNLLVVFIFVFANGIDPRWTWLELIPLVGLLIVLATGVSMLVSALYVRYRDVQPIWEVTLQILFYASPVIYVVSAMPASVRQEAVANPIAAILTQLRYALIDPNAPSAGEAIGGAVYLLIPLAIVVVVSALGLWIFMREAPRIAEDL